MQHDISSGVVAKLVLSTLTVMVALWCSVTLGAGSPEESAVPPSSQALPIGRVIFWFYSGEAVDNFLSNPAPGVTAIQMAIRFRDRGPEWAERIRKAHSNRIAVMGALPGNIGKLGRNHAESIAAGKEYIDWWAGIGGDALFVDEPYGRGLDDPRECGPGCYDQRGVSDSGIEWIVSTYGELQSYFAGLRPGGQFGVCHGGLVGIRFHEKALRAGLKEDFACLEAYGYLNVKDAAYLKQQFPQVKLLLLLYSSRLLCDNWTEVLQEPKELAGIDTYGFWDLDNYPAWVPGKDKYDPMWLFNARRFAAGDTSFCRSLPRSRFPLILHSDH